MMMRVRLEEAKTLGGLGGVLLDTIRNLFVMA
jgi:hypothetical protein